MMRNKKLLLTLTGILVIIIGASAFFTAKTLSSKKDTPSKVLGASTKKLDIYTDFSKQIASGSPLVFGGVHVPAVEDVGMWDILADSGITLVRSDFFIEFCAPKNITVEAYKNNVNNIQDISKWPQGCMSNVSQAYSMAKSKNMKVVGVVAYTPAWLSSTKGERGMPTDWEVYEDIVKKIYKKNRNNLDYIEIWNEPDHPKFLTVPNQSQSKQQLYAEFYMHVAKAIKQVDTEINDGKFAKIGGPSISCPCNDGFIKELIANPELKPYIDFISIHSYQDGDKYIPKIHAMMKEYGYEKTPLYISEWNRHGTANQFKQYNQTYLAVPYTAERFITFLKNNVQMASYFSLRENDPGHELPERQSYGFYRKNWKGFDVFPQALVWKLFSKNLKLGLGNSKIMSTSASGSIPTIGFINLDGEQGVILANNTSDSYSVTFNASNLAILNKTTDVKISSITQKDGLEEDYCIERFTPKTTNMMLRFDIPESSVTTIKFSPVQLSLKIFLQKILGISTNQSCITFKE